MEFGDLSDFVLEYTWERQFPEELVFFRGVQTCHLPLLSFLVYRLLPRGAESYLIVSHRIPSYAVTFRRIQSTPFLCCSGSTWTPPAKSRRGPASLRLNRRVRIHFSIQYDVFKYACWFMIARVHTWYVYLSTTLLVYAAS